METQSKFATLQAGGEEYENIIAATRATFGNDFGRKPLYISMMLSLSFFWKSREMLEQLANTINLIKDEYYRSIPKGSKNQIKFLFFTIEGERTLKFFEEHDNSAVLNGVIMNYKDDVVYIDIRGSIVENQTEYIVKLKELFAITDMKLKYEKSANHEKLLSENEKKLTSLYVYGEYIINNSTFNIYESIKESRKQDKIINLEKVQTPKRRSRTPSPTRPKTPVVETIFDKLENIELPIPEELRNQDNSKEETLKLSIKTGYVDDEGYYVPSESNSSLFECIIKYFNPEAPYVPMNEVIKYRNEMALSIRNTNPFDNANRSIFVSAGKGFLKDVSVNKTDAVTWIASDNELPPPYLVWIPDTIGVNLKVNGENYLTTRISNELETIVLKYENKHYRVKI
jgi:hypothetical protein